jgi:glycosyltransferase involved in cell wall biosynthesis
VKVLFLTLYPQYIASSRYRIHQWAEGLEKAGIECEVRSALTDDEHVALQGHWKKYHWLEMTRRWKQLSDVQDFDVVVVQKGITTPGFRGFWNRLRNRAKKIILDVDDAVHLQQPVQLGAPWKWCCDLTQIRTIMKEAELVWAGNRWLCEQINEIGGESSYLPTCVNTDKFVPNPNKLNDLVVGWMGNPSTSPALEKFAAVLNNLKDVPVRIIGAANDYAPISHGSYIPWSLESEVKELQQISVGLMPLEGTEWNKGKCALKALLYMSCGIPCIASPCGPINDIIDHRKNGLFVEDDQALIEAISFLQDKPMREALGKAARKKVVDEFSISTWLPEMARSLKEVSGKP